MCVFTYLNLEGGVVVVAVADTPGVHGGNLEVVLCATLQVGNVTENI